MINYFRIIVYYKIFLISVAVFLLFLGSNIIVQSLKFDSIFIVLGNFAIAFIVAKILTSRQKKDEISLDHCIKDISELLNLLQEIKDDIQEVGQKAEKSNIKFLNKSLNTKTNTVNINMKKREIVSKVSIFEQLIGMLENHTLIDPSNIDRIKSIFTSFEDDIMGTDSIKEQWFDSHLKLQRHLLIMKSDVSKKFRQ